MNTAMMTLFGPSSQQMVINPQLKQKEEGKTDKALFGSLLTDVQGISTMRKANEVKPDGTKEAIELIGKIEAMISTLVEQGKWSESEGADWQEPIRQVKAAATEGLISKMVSPMEELTQQMITEETFSDLSVEYQELTQTFTELTSLVEGIIAKSESSMLRVSSSPSFNGEEMASTSKPVRTEQNLHNTWQEMRKIIQTFTENDSSPHISHKAGKEMKELMQKFMQLVESLSNKDKDLGQGLLDRVTKEASVQERQVFNKLIHMYQNRMDVPKTYHQQTPMTGKDMVKWVKQALGEDAKHDTKLQEPLKQQPFSSAATMPMTKVEQYVIHINQNQEGASSQKQLIQKLEKIIQSSRMFTNPKGNMEMLIKLKPGNLGDLTVKFAQINGEMAVKILVNSQTAKEMLEGNKTQLRHMFSPQQVVIEKVESSALQQQLHDQLDSGKKDQDQHQKQKHDLAQDQVEEPQDEELSFHEILMNEKV